MYALFTWQGSRSMMMSDNIIFNKNLHFNGSYFTVLICIFFFFLLLTIIVFVQSLGTAQCTEVTMELKVHMLNSAWSIWLVPCNMKTKRICFLWSNMQDRVTWVWDKWKKMLSQRFTLWFTLSGRQFSETRCRACYLLRFLTRRERVSNKLCMTT